MMKSGRPAYCPGVKETLQKQNQRIIGQLASNSTFKEEGEDMIDL